MNDIFLIHDITVLIDTHHRNSTAGRSNDRIHGDIIGTVYTQVRDLLASTSIHEDRGNEYY
jgi:hypothetical protein